MPTLFEYIDEYGNFTFDEVPFTEADNVAFAQLAYCPLGEAVPRLGSRSSVTFEQAWRAYARTYSGEMGFRSPSRGGLDVTEQLFQAMAQCARFRNVRLAAFEERFDLASHEQFAAYTALLTDGSSYVSFRGTDNYIAGWRENFMMSYEVVGAQSDARRYLDDIARQTSGRLHVGGHSKGGNLAAYAAAHCSADAQSRIAAVWCNDPPGFMREVVDFKAFDAISDRIRLFVPEFCVVAGIMEQVKLPEVIVSSAARYRQHDATTWIVGEGGGSLERSAMLEPDCRPVAKVFYRLIYTRSLSERVEIVNDLFDAFSMAGIETVNGFLEGAPASVERVVAQLRSCDAKTRQAVREVLLALAGQELGSSVTRLFKGVDEAVDRLLGNGSGSRPRSVHPSSSPGRGREGDSVLGSGGVRVPDALARGFSESPLTVGSALVVAGVLVMANADADAPVLGYAAVIAVAVFAVFLLVRYVLSKLSGGEQSVNDLAMGAIALVPAVLLLAFHLSITVLYNLIVGSALVASGLVFARRCYGGWHARGGFTPMVVVRGIVASLMGAVGLMILVDPMRLTTPLLLAAGAIIVATGAARMVKRPL